MSRPAASAISTADWRGVPLKVLLLRRWRQRLRDVVSDVPQVIERIDPSKRRHVVLARSRDGNELVGALAGNERRPAAMAARPRLAVTRNARSLVNLLAVGAVNRPRGAASRGVSSSTCCGRTGGRSTLPADRNRRSSRATGRTDRSTSASRRRSASTSRRTPASSTTTRRRSRRPIRRRPSRNSRRHRLHLPIQREHPNPIALLAASEHATARVHNDVLLPLVLKRGHRRIDARVRVELPQADAHCACRAQ